MLGEKGLSDTANALGRCGAEHKGLTTDQIECSCIPEK